MGDICSKIRHRQMDGDEDVIIKMVPIRRQKSQPVKFAGISSKEYQQKSESKQQQLQQQFSMNQADLTKQKLCSKNLQGESQLTTEAGGGVISPKPRSVKFQEKKRLSQNLQPASSIVKSSLNINNYSNFQCYQTENNIFFQDLLLNTNLKQSNYQNTNYSPNKEQTLKTMNWPSQVPEELENSTKDNKFKKKDRKDLIIKLIDHFQQFEPVEMSPKLQRLYSQHYNTNNNNDPLKTPQQDNNNNQQISDLKINLNSTNTDLNNLKNSNYYQENNSNLQDLKKHQVLMQEREFQKDKFNKYTRNFFSPLHPRKKNLGLNNMTSTTPIKKDQQVFFAGACQNFENTEENEKNKDASILDISTLNYKNESDIKGLLLMRSSSPYFIDNEELIYESEHKYNSNNNKEKNQNCNDIREHVFS